MLSWYWLPTELRLLIWNILISDASEDRQILRIQLDTSSRKPISLAACTAVSRDWQAYFEPVTFRRLFVESTEVEQFVAATQGPRKARLGYIHHLHLHVRLHDYDCSQCDKAPDAEALARDKAVFTKALWPLLRALARWGTQKVDGTHERHGIALELSASSWSDAAHGYRDFKLQRDYPYELAEDVDWDFTAYKHYTRREIADRKRRSRDLHRAAWEQEMPVPSAMADRVFGVRPLGAWTQRRAPRLRIVRALVVRRRFYRAIDPNLLSWLLRSGPCSIRELRVEQWSRDAIHKLALNLAKKPLPRTVEALLIYYKATESSTAREQWSLRYPDTEAALAKASRPLQCIAITNLVQATDFFGMAVLQPKGYHWPRLRAIALTDRRLRPFGEGHELVKLAARMALEMPALEIMELWNQALGTEGTPVFQPFNFLYHDGPAFPLSASSQEERHGSHSRASARDDGDNNGDGSGAGCLSDKCGRSSAQFFSYAWNHGDTTDDGGDSDSADRSKRIEAAVHCFDKPDAATASTGARGTQRNTLAPFLAHALPQPPPFVNQARPRVATVGGGRHGQPCAAKVAHGYAQQPVPEHCPACRESDGGQQQQRPCASRWWRGDKHRGRWAQRRAPFVAVGVEPGQRPPAPNAVLSDTLRAGYLQIEQRFQELMWLERSRMIHNALHTSFHGSSPTASSARAPKSSDASNTAAPHHPRALDRYMNIQPWDANRVRLRVPPGRVDYINASPIVLTTTAPAHAARPPDRYIAMQGPKQASVDHVWRMVYEQLRSPAVIVMLTETHEANQEKCYPYFPRHPDDPPMLVNEQDEFGDGFHASVRCAALEPTPYGDAIELRRIVLRVHRKADATAAMAGPESSDATAPNGRAAAPSGDTDHDMHGATTTAAAPTATAAPEAPAAAAGPATAATAATTTTTTETTTPDEDTGRGGMDLDDYEDERIVYHFLYKRWPDFGVPTLEDVPSFFGLMRLSADKNADADNPRIVHCSAGVGRSGTFIALEHLQRELDAGVLARYDDNDDDDDDKEKNDTAVPDSPGSDGVAGRETDDLIFTTVNQLREQRRAMVQADAQYLFIYRVLRKLWEEKYGGSGGVGSGVGSRSSGSQSNNNTDETQFDVSDGSEPAPKRLEVDPFR
ncbi:protein-tyrosine phosphatase 2 [Niveomyces insectorum RCEF 264]|uniref:Protein-tyrosine phosphatase 2 n=1 Tax=Niveomyces insectorum RCEF 264 TaxID=1081102 RepID=A0A162MNV4_9HYPO|nr:protein-tyrosine phosphatase 2 [Niveomyces insectorum RCEF 264]